MKKLVDRMQVKREFAMYVSDFDAADEMVHLKIVHTYRVAELCEQIALSAGLSEEEADLAWLLGMLHDIGRFVQIREYGTFDDAKSIDHAQGSIRVLFEERYIRRFIETDVYDELIDTAIRYHNAYRLPSDLSGKVQIFCDVLRDADKIDILRLDSELTRTAIYGKDIDLADYQEVSQVVFDEFMSEKAILRKNIQNQIDRIIGHASLVFELVYPVSRQIVFEKGYADYILSMKTHNKKAHEQLRLMREKLNSYMESASC